MLTALTVYIATTKNHNKNNRVVMTNNPIIFIIKLLLTGNRQCFNLWFLMS